MQYTNMFSYFEIELQVVLIQKYTLLDLLLYNGNKLI